MRVFRLRLWASLGHCDPSIHTVERRTETNKLLEQDRPGRKLPTVERQYQDDRMSSSLFSLHVRFDSSIIDAVTTYAKSPMQYIPAIFQSSHVRPNTWMKFRVFM